MENYSSLATVKIVPGNIDAAFREVRFTNGMAGGDVPATAPFRGAFDDSFLWITDDAPPARGDASPRVGSARGPTTPGACTAVGLTCINAIRQSAFDPDGLNYCSRGCTDKVPCVAGYVCSTSFTILGGDEGADVSSGACLRLQPSY